MKTVRSDRYAFYLPSLAGGGAERVMLTLAGGMAARGFDVDLVLAKAVGPYLRDISPQVRMVDLGATRVLTSLPGLVRYMREYQPRALISTLSHANIIALLAKTVSGVPVKLVVRQANIMASKGNSPVNSVLSKLAVRMEKTLVSWFYPRADMVVAPSNGVKNDLIVNAGIENDRIRVIHNPIIEAELYEKANDPLDESLIEDSSIPLVLAVGRLTPQKDFSTLIRAFARVRQQCPAKLLILGEGECRRELEALVTRFGLDAAVSMPGFDNNPFKYMAHAAVFVLSSSFEGLPNVLLQALALGVPVVSTDCESGPNEILDNGKYGKLVPVADEVAMSKAILDSIRNGTRRDIPDTLLSSYRKEHILEQFLEVILDHCDE